MPETPVSRRSFMAASASAPVAAAEAREPVVVETVRMSDIRAQADPLQIVTTYQFEPHEVEKIKAAVPNTRVDIKICRGQQEFRAHLANAEVVYGGLNADTLGLAPKVKWVQWGGAGMEGLDPKVRESSVVVTNYAGTFAPAISETAIGLLLCLTRGITKYYMPQFAKRQMNPIGSPKSADHSELVGRTMAIVGLGGIGSMIARRAYYGFDMKIVATDARPIPKPDFVAELHDPGWFMEMVPRADVLVAAAPHTPETERMFNKEVFRRMKKTAYFLAVSRGMLIDDLALVRALKEGWIAGAGLDVFPKEPPPSDHPIYDCPNVVMTAHTSGWSPDRQARLIEVFADNVRRYVNGLPLVNVVDKKRGY